MEEILRGVWGKDLGQSGPNGPVQTVSGPNEVSPRLKHECVHDFQSALQGILKMHAKNAELRWEELFSPRLALHNHPLRKLLNGATSICDGGWEDCDVTDATTAPIGPIGSNDMPLAWW